MLANKGKKRSIATILSAQPRIYDHWNQSFATFRVVANDLANETDLLLEGEDDEQMDLNAEHRFVEPEDHDENAQILDANTQIINIKDYFEICNRHQRRIKQGITRLIKPAKDYATEQGNIFLELVRFSISPNKQIDKRTGRDFKLEIVKKSPETVLLEALQVWFTFLLLLFFHRSWENII